MTPEERRRRENAALLKRMKDPKDNLCHTDISAFRWAPRKRIEKDAKAMAELYGEEDTKE